MSFCLWLTGLPGSGKSEIRNELSRMLSESEIEAVTLSLDHIRKVLTPEPKYTDEERKLVYRSLVLMAQLLVEQGEKNVIIDATGNRREFRYLARRMIPEFAEIYVKCSLETCKAREASRRPTPWRPSRRHPGARRESPSPFLHPCTGRQSHRQGIQWNAAPHPGTSLK